MGVEVEPWFTVEGFIHLLIQCCSPAWQPLSCFGLPANHQAAQSCAVLGHANHGAEIDVLGTTPAQMQCNPPQQLQAASGMADGCDALWQDLSSGGGCDSAISGSQAAADFPDHVDSMAQLQQVMILAASQLVLHLAVRQYSKRCPVFRKACLLSGHEAKVRKDAATGILKALEQVDMAGVRSLSGQDGVCQHCACTTPNSNVEQHKNGQLPYTKQHSPVKPANCEMPAADVQHLRHVRAHQQQPSGQQLTFGVGELCFITPVLMAALNDIVSSHKDQLHGQLQDQLHGQLQDQYHGHLQDQSHGQLHSQSHGKSEPSGSMQHAGNGLIAQAEQCMAHGVATPIQHTLADAKAGLLCSACMAEQLLAWSLHQVHSIADGLLLLQQQVSTLPQPACPDEHQSPTVGHQLPVDSRGCLAYPCASSEPVIDAAVTDAVVTDHPATHPGNTVAASDASKDQVAYLSSCLATGAAEKRQGPIQDDVQLPDDQGGAAQPHPTDAEDVLLWLEPLWHLVGRHGMAASTEDVVADACDCRTETAVGEGMVWSQFTASTWLKLGVATLLYCSNVSAGHDHHGMPAASIAKARVLLQQVVTELQDSPIDPQQQLLVQWVTTWLCTDAEVLSQREHKRQLESFKVSLTDAVKLVVTHVMLPECQHAAAVQYQHSTWRLLNARQSVRSANIAPHGLK
eukprot:jgi/Chrzof1/3423/Cz12g24220.t1